MTRVSDLSADWVQARREAGYGWAAIARMAGVAESDLRRAHDPARGAMGPVVVPPPVSPRAQVRRVLQGRGLGPDEARMVARLWQANGARVPARDLVRGLDRPGDAYEAACQARREAERLGLGFVACGHRSLQLTPSAVVAISVLAGLSPGLPKVPDALPEVTP